MENEELYEEIITDTFNESDYDSELVDTIEEVETVSKDNEVDTVESILLLLEERLSEKEEVEEEDALLSTPSGVAAEQIPVLVQSTNEIDYSDLLVSIDEKLDLILQTESGVLAVNQPRGIYTPLDDYNLSEFLLLMALLGFGLFVGVNAIKNLCFKLK